MADDLQSLCAKHRHELQTFREKHLTPCLESGDESNAKFIKTIADTIRIVQEAERRSFLSNDIDDGIVEVEWS